MKSAQQIFAGLRSRARTGILIEAASCIIAILAAYVFVSYGIDRTFRLEKGYRIAMLGILGYIIVRTYVQRLHQPLRFELADDEIALAVERQDAGIRQSLISAVQFQREIDSGRATGESTDLMQHVIQDVQDRTATIAFHRALNGARVAKFGGLLAICLVTVLSWAIAYPSEAALWAQRNLGFGNTPWPRDTYLTFVGEDVSKALRLAEREDLTLRVHAEGTIPEKVFMQVDFEGGESTEYRCELVGKDVFSVTLESMLENAVVQAFGGDGISSKLKIVLVPRPHITDINLTVSYPAYMSREPHQVADTGGDVRIPLGGTLGIEAISSKALRQANLSFGQDLKIPAEITDGGMKILSKFSPTENGILSINALDKDDLGPAQPPQIYLRVAEDNAPRVDFKTDGIGTLISPIALIPGNLKIRDDYGLTSVSASYQVTNARNEDGKKPEDVPFISAPVNGLNAFVAGSDEFDGPTIFDLKQLVVDADPASPNNPIRPGHILALRFSAKDNFAPDGQAASNHEGSSETLHFRVVTLEKLLDELRRRQEEQRRELERIRDKEKALREELAEILSPNGDSPQNQQARLRTLSLSRQQGALGNRVQGIANRYRQILREMVNNRLFEPSRTSQLEGQIVSPLTVLALEDFPYTAGATGTFANSGDEKLRTSAVTGYDGILAVIEQVLLHMERTESLAAVVESLRLIIKTEEQASNVVEKLRDKQGNELFGPKKK